VWEARDNDRSADTVEEGLEELENILGGRRIPLDHQAVALVHQDDLE